MKRYLDDLEPGQFKLREPIWKFDSLVLDAGTLLTARELAKLRDWGLRRVDVVPVEGAVAEEAEAPAATFAVLLPAVEPEPYAERPGVTDVVPAAALELLEKTDLHAIRTIEDLENLDFDLDPAACQTPSDLYLPDAIRIPPGYGAREIRKSTTDLADFLKLTFEKIEAGENFDFKMMKLLITLKIEELKGFCRELVRTTFAAREGDYLFEHSVGVMILALSVGGQLGYKENWLAELGIAAMLHDVGMAKLDRAQYLLPKKWTFDDYFDVFKHPILGVDYLTRTLRSRFGGLVTLAVYQHHERLDGSGYPKGRKGAGISEYARIIGVCDVYDAMTHDRPYRTKFPPVEAFRFLAENAGLYFDRRIVDALHAVLSREGILTEDLMALDEVRHNPVLIADTSPYNLWYICQILRNNRIPVYAARTEADLLAASHTTEPKVVMIDASINAKKGLDLIAQLKKDEATRKVPLIYCSTSGDKSDVVRAIQLGVGGYLKKPYTFDFVVNRLSKFLC